MQWWFSCLIHRWFIIVLLHDLLFPDVTGGTSPSVVTAPEVVTKLDSTREVLGTILSYHGG